MKKLLVRIILRPPFCASERKFLIFEKEKKIIIIILLVVVGGVETVENYVL